MLNVRAHHGTIKKRLKKEERAARRKRLLSKKETKQSMETLFMFAKFHLNKPQNLCNSFLWIDKIKMEKMCP